MRRIGTDGIINTVAGNGDTDYSYARDGGPAPAVEVNAPIAVAVGPEGQLYIVESDRVRVVEPASPSVSLGETFIPSRDGKEVFVFDTSGRHLRTVESLTGSLLYEFTYDADGLLDNCRWRRQHHDI